MVFSVFFSVFCGKSRFGMFFSSIVAGLHGNSKNWHFYRPFTRSRQHFQFGLKKWDNLFVKLKRSFYVLFWRPVEAHKMHCRQKTETSICCVSFQTVWTLHPPLHSVSKGLGQRPFCCIRFVCLDFHCIQLIIFDDFLAVFSFWLFCNEFYSWLYFILTLLPASWAWQTIENYVHF